MKIIMIILKMKKIIMKIEKEIIAEEIIIDILLKMIPI